MRSYSSDNGTFKRLLLELSTLYQETFPVDRDIFDSIHHSPHGLQFNRISTIPQYQLEQFLRHLGTDPYNGTHDDSFLCVGIPNEEKAEVLRRSVELTRSGNTQ